MSVRCSKEVCMNKNYCRRCVVSKNVGVRWNIKNGTNYFYPPPLLHNFGSLLVCKMCVTIIVPVNVNPARGGGCRFILVRCNYNKIPTYIQLTMNFHCQNLLPKDLVSSLFHTYKTGVPKIQNDIYKSVKSIPNAFWSLQGQIVNKSSNIIKYSPENRYHRW